jgi:predicted Zn-dependent peptidase
MKENIQTTRFSNGLTILTEKMPDLRSATIGFWFRCGSRDEPTRLNGISHFIEHAVFKGTNKRNALDIAVETDRLGGNFDAFTMHEQTAFTLKVTDKAVPQAFDLLADMLTDPVFDEKELRREQKVIIEEMKMVEDSPEEYLGEIFQKNFFSGDVLGLPIEGTQKTVLTFDSEVTAKYHGENFQPHNLVITAAGNIEHEQIIELAEKYFGSSAPALKRETAVKLIETTQPAERILLKNKKGLEQSHFILAAAWIEETSEKRYAAHLLENILGSGTSSRLWQKIREERGLAYSIGATGVSYRDRGVFNIYGATSADQFEETIDIAIAEMRRIKNEAVSDDELDLAKDQSAATLLLSLEDSGVRAGNLAQQEITHGRQIPVDETLQKLEQVTVEDVQRIANDFFVSEGLVLTAIGNFSGVKIAEDRLEM